MARRTFWIDNLIELSVGTGSGTQQSLLSGTPPINVRGSTVVRVIYRLGLVSSTVGVADGALLVDIGVGIASQEAFTAVVLPDPDSDERPVGGWMFRDRCLVSYGSDMGNPITWCKEDIHAGKKLTDGEVFMRVQNKAVVGATSTVEIVGLVRLLLLLP